ncbi:MAG: 16S rRNA (uracil(1498)-N(3))-methyltransferase [Bacteroidales bacterium]|jgi:16S rRNA (uracil1498-N3)-methyltransferase
MNIFYSSAITGDTCVLDESESRHCIRVLRMREGSVVRITDGNGNIYEGVVSSADAKRCRIRITGIVYSDTTKDYTVHIAISPLKNHERLEWFTEKCVEIGLDELTPVICHNTEKEIIKPDRLNGIIVAAMKQSLKAFRPVLNNPVTFVDFVRKDFTGKKLIAHCKNDIERNSIGSLYLKGETVTILIGPEGDFTEAEINLAMVNGFQPVHLGKSRLRTETAGIAACHSVYFINQ